MNFSLTEEQLFWQKKSKNFAETYLKPMVEDLDAGKLSYKDVIRIANQENFRHWWIPNEYDGPGVMGKVIGCLITEELSKVSLDIMQIVSGPSLAGQFILHLGDDKQKDKYLKKLANKKTEYVAAFALTEADSGSDVSQIQTRARPVKGGFLLSGEKIYITNGDIADVLVVGAKLLSDDRDVLKFFIVDKDISGDFKTSRIRTSGITAAHLGEITFKDYFVDENKVLGFESRGTFEGDFLAFVQLMESSRIGVAAASVGIAQAAWDYTVQQMKNNKRAGKSLISNQAIRFSLLDSKNQIEAARLLVLRAAWMQDKGHPFVGAEGNLAKVFASEVAQKTVVSCSELIGAKAFVHGNPMDKCFRDVRACLLWEGTTNVLKELSARVFT